MAGALGVCAASLYYVMNLREITKNRKSAFTLGLIDTISSKEGLRDWIELMSMHWSDFEDFRRKYDSSINPQSAAVRGCLFANMDSYGKQLRQWLISIDSISNIDAFAVVDLWLKFKPIIKGYRGW